MAVVAVVATTAAAKSMLTTATMAAKSFSRVLSSTATADAVVRHANVRCKRDSVTSRVQTRSRPALSDLRTPVREIFAGRKRWNIEPFKNLRETEAPVGLLVRS